VRDAEPAARAIGINPVLVRTQAFAVSAAAAGLAGALFAPMAGFISPENFTFLQSILFLLLAILGGVGTLTGPAMGALVIAGLPELLSPLAEYRLMIFGVLLLVILWLRPEGLASLYETARHRHSGAPGGDAARALAWLGGGAREGVLRVRELAIAFGGIKAVQAVSFDVAAAEVRGLIGPNGAGKTSLLNLIGGFYRADAGSLARGDSALLHLPTHRLARAGVARTFQAAQMFGSLSVRDNLGLALPPGTPPMHADDLLALVGYTGSADAGAGDLPFVDRRLVEIARALACRPDTLLLDEPAAGLSAAEKARLTALLRKLSGAGLRVLLVEHDVRMVMQACDRIAVLDGGRLIADGLPAEVRVNPDVVAAYLGAAQVQARDRVRKAGEPLLQVEGLGAGYGSLPVLEDIALQVREGEVVALIGANGAGKSTLMKALSGLLPHRGAARWIGGELAGMPAHARVKAGLSLVPEGRQVFPELSVADNLALGGYTRNAAERGATAAAMLAKFPRLDERRDQRAGTLSGGEQQMLALARALMSRPRLLMLDEPSLGLAPRLVSEVYDTVQALAAEGTTLLLVDQFARSALTVADHACVLAAGRVRIEGTAAALMSAPEVVDEYLGDAA
jgi:ABC-type branched-subunit amino acid transport system ATPase component